jgi:CDP-diacylglycerol--glycerol-3-phosphate 3-phosphatidyltransferase
MAKPPITANQVTLLRLLLLPIGGILMYGSSTARWIAIGFMTLLGLTDYVDGWLARRYGSTELGRLMDPIADKVFVMVCFMPFIDLRVEGSGRPWLFAWQVGLLLSREYVVTALRSVYERRHIAPRTTLLAKIKAWAQMAGCGVLFMLRFVPERVMLIVLAIGTALPLLLIIGRYIAQRVFWRGALIFAAWEMAALLPLWLFGAETAVQTLILTVIGVTWLSGWDYIAPALPLFMRRQLDRGDWVRLLGGLVVPVLLIWAQASGHLPTWVIMLVMGLEMAMGGLDNLLCQNAAQSSALAWGLRVGLVSLLTLLAGLRPTPEWPSTPFMMAAGAVSLLGTAFEFYRGRRYYLNEPPAGTPIRAD